MSITRFVPRANRIGLSGKDRQRRTVAVIGNGIIGHGVAQVFGMAGIGVVMIGRSRPHS
jgi:threonine dehydrogenase-like Zn-dependent dehydrogenase